MHPRWLPSSFGDSLGSHPYFHPQLFATITLIFKPIISPFFELTEGMVDLVIKELESHEQGRLLHYSADLESLLQEFAMPLQKFLFFVHFAPNGSSWLALQNFQWEPQSHQCNQSLHIHSFFFGSSHPERFTLNLDGYASCNKLCQRWEG